MDTTTTTAVSRALVTYHSAIQGWVATTRPAGPAGTHQLRLPGDIVVETDVTSGDDPVAMSVLAAADSTVPPLAYAAADLLFGTEVADALSRREPQASVPLTVVDSPARRALLALIALADAGLPGVIEHALAARLATESGEVFLPYARQRAAAAVVAFRSLPAEVLDALNEADLQALHTLAGRVRLLIGEDVPLGTTSDTLTARYSTTPSDVTVELTGLLVQEITASMRAAAAQVRAGNRALVSRGGRPGAAGSRNGADGRINTAGMLPAALQDVGFFWSFDEQTRDLTVVADQDVAVPLWLRVSLPDGTVTGVFQGRVDADGHWRSDGKAVGEVVHPGDEKQARQVRLACQLEVITDLDQPVWTPQQYAQRSAQRAGVAARRLLDEVLANSPVSLQQWLTVTAQWTNVGRLWEAVDDRPRAVIAYRLAIRCAAQGAAEDMAFEAAESLNRLDPGWANTVADVPPRRSPAPDNATISLARALARWACTQLGLVAQHDTRTDNLEVRLRRDEDDITQIAAVGGPHPSVQEAAQLALLRLASIALRHARVDDGRRLVARVTDAEVRPAAYRKLQEDLMPVLRRLAAEARQQDW